MAKRRRHTPDQITRKLAEGNKAPPEHLVLLLEEADAFLRGSQQSSNRTRPNNWHECEHCKQNSAVLHKNAKGGGGSRISMPDQTRARPQRPLMNVEFS